MNLSEYPTPITDAAEKSPFQHAAGSPPPLYMSAESGIVRDLECCLSIARDALEKFRGQLDRYECSGTAEETLESTKPKS